MGLRASNKKVSDGKPQIAGKDMSNIFFQLFVWVLFWQIPKSNGTIKPEPTSYAAYMSKAENLVLQRDRLKACAILTQAYKKLEKKSERLLILEKLNFISELFFTDLAQQNFEQARSMYHQSSTLAFNKLETAKRLEPFNFLIGQVFVSYMLTQTQYKKASEEASRYLNVNPYNKFMARLYLLSLLKDANWEQLTKFLEEKSNIDMLAKHELDFLKAFILLGQDSPIEEMPLVSHPELQMALNWNWFKLRDGKKAKGIAEGLLKHCDKELLDPQMRVPFVQFECVQKDQLLEYLGKNE